MELGEVVCCTKLKGYVSGPTQTHSQACDMLGKTK